MGGLVHLTCRGRSGLKRERLGLTAVIRWRKFGLGGMLQWTSRVFAGSTRRRHGNFLNRIGVGHEAHCGQSHQSSCDRLGICLGLCGRSACRNCIAQGICVEGDASVVCASMDPKRQRAAKPSHPSACVAASGAVGQRQGGQHVGVEGRCPSRVLAYWSLAAACRSAFALASNWSGIAHPASSRDLGGSGIGKGLRRTWSFTFRG